MMRYKPLIAAVSWAKVFVATAKFPLFQSSNELFNSLE
jgi:hypothetical protein